MFSFQFLIESTNFEYLSFSLTNLANSVGVISVIECTDDSGPYTNSAIASLRLPSQGINNPCSLTSVTSMSVLVRSPVPVCTQLSTLLFKVCSVLLSKLGIALSKLGTDLDSRLLINLCTIIS